MSDPFRLDGKVALVTGASRGLGEAMAVSLAEAGADVVLLARSVDGLAGTAKRIRSLGRKAAEILCDVRSASEIERACREAEKALGPIEILVNNAGIGHVRTFMEVSLEEWNEILQVNLTSYFLFCKQFFPGWSAKKRGKVINIASIDGLIGESHLVPYCASKGGVVQLTRALALEWAPHGINVNAIAPGYFVTDMNRDAIEDPKKGPAMIRRIPLRRTGRPEELGPLAVYLASGASDFMTGEVVVIDGGQVIK